MKERQASGDGGFRIRVAVQRDRASIFSFALALSLVLQWTGLIHTSYGLIFSLFVVTNASAWILTKLLKRGIPFVLIDPLWLSLDVFFVSWAVYASGGASSPWWPWYLPVISGAAFVIGLSAAFLTFLGSLAAYLITLVLCGDITGFGPTFYHATAAMVCLYASSVFFLRGVRQLQRKRRVISEMAAEDRRKLEALTELTGELEAKSEALRSANSKLREIDRLKSQFLANVSHELRTPLNSIIGFSEILSQRGAESRDERETRYLGYIHRSGRRLLAVIDDILDLSRMEAGIVTLAPEKMAIRSTIEGVTTLLKGVANRRSVTVEIDVDSDSSLVTVDPTRVKQILYHLIENAIKFSPEGGVVSVRASRGADSEAQRQLILEVEDRGEGMEAEVLETIFRPFRQVDGSVTRRHEGAGLGLAIVHEATALHEGEVSVRSEPGKGTVFTVVLPLGLAPSPVSNPVLGAPAIQDPLVTPSSATFREEGKVHA